MSALPSHPVPPAAALPWTRGNLHGMVMAGYEELDPGSMPWQEAAEERPLPEGFKLAKRSKSRLVISFKFRGERLYAKRAIPRTLGRKLSVRLQGPKAIREWDVSREFLAGGILVPEPLLMASVRNGYLSYFITRGFPREWKSFRFVLRHNLLDAKHFYDVGAMARWLHDSQAYHADFRSDHIYVTTAPAGSPLPLRFALLDLDGAFIRRRVSTRQRQVAFERLFLSLAAQKRSDQDIDQVIQGYEGAGPSGLSLGGIWRDAVQKSARMSHEEVEEDD